MTRSNYSAMKTYICNPLSLEKGGDDRKRIINKVIEIIVTIV